MTGWERALGHQQVDFAVRLVFSLALLVLHDAPLFVHLRGVDDAEQMAHAVRFHPQRYIKRSGGDVLEVIGAIVVRGAVLIRRANALEGLEVVVVEVLAAVEHQVLEQMREPRAPGPLVLGAHMVPDVDGDDRRLVVLVDEQRQPVFQHEALIRDGDRRRSGRPRGGPPRGGSRRALGGSRCWQGRGEPERHGQKRYAGHGNLLKKADGGLNRVRRYYIRRAWLPSRNPNSGKSAPTRRGKSPKRHASRNGPRRVSCAISSSASCGWT